MIYQIRNKYFKGQNLDFLKRILRLIVPIVGQWCNYYSVAIFTQKKIQQKFTNGKLPDDLTEKSKVLNEIAKYVSDNLETEQFLLWLDSDSFSRFKLQARVYKFDHHDDTQSWVLNLTENEYKQLQEVFSKNQLPMDLFVLAN